MNSSAAYGRGGLGGVSATQAADASYAGAVEEVQIADDKLFMTWPTIGGFSFATKKWGEVPVEIVQDVVFDRKAFERLVLPAEKKALILALVEKQGETVADFIDGKGGGCIFLLHGPPGTGKTLTAESVSEFLEKPLYSVTVGELGVNVSELEAALSKVLEVASRWDAVILLDEADIFLERRALSDIQRNALVGVFLRLLEYHQGVLFLTTNRVKAFDAAMYSRISVALRYPSLGEKSREKVWRQVLSLAGLQDAKLDVLSLAKSDLNGRQIRTIVKLASSLALQEGVPTEQRHFDQCIAISTNFRETLLESGVDIEHVEGGLTASTGN